MCEIYTASIRRQESPGGRGRVQETIGYWCKQHQFLMARKQRDGECLIGFSNRMKAEKKTTRDEVQTELNAQIDGMAMQS